MLRECVQWGQGSQGGPNHKSGSREAESAQGAGKEPAGEYAARSDRGEEDVTNRGKCHRNIRPIAGGGHGDCRSQHLRGSAKGLKAAWCFLNLSGHENLGI